MKNYIDNAFTSKMIYFAPCDKIGINSINSNNDGIVEISFTSNIWKRYDWNIKDFNSYCKKPYYTTIFYENILLLKLDNLKEIYNIDIDLVKLMDNVFVFKYENNYYIIGLEESNNKGGTDCYFKENNTILVVTNKETHPPFNITEETYNKIINNNEL